MRRAAVLVVLFACLAAAGCGDRGEPGADAARHLDPRSDAVVAVDLDYEGASWQQVKRLYARAVQEGVLDEGELEPPTLDGALGVLARYSGLSFSDDVRPLLGGALHVGVRTEPAAAAPAQRDDRRPAPTVTVAYQVQDAEALKRVLEKLRGQGLEPKPIEGLQGLGSGGLTGLLFVAPDAPLTPSAFGLLAQVDVSRLPSGGPDDLYEVRGLAEGGAAPDRIVYGIAGDAFVVASSPELAREVGAMDTEPVEEAATRARADVAALVEQGVVFFGGDGEARAASAVRGRRGERRGAGRRHRGRRRAALGALAASAAVSVMVMAGAPRTSTACLEGMGSAKRRIRRVERDPCDVLRPIRAKRRNAPARAPRIATFCAAADEPASSMPAVDVRGAPAITSAESAILTHGGRVTADGRPRSPRPASGSPIRA